MHHAAAHVSNVRLHEVVDGDSCRDQGIRASIMSTGLYFGRASDEDRRRLAEGDSAPVVDGMLQRSLFCKCEVTRVRTAFIAKLNV